MNYAVINASGKQYKVTPGLIVEVDKIDGEKDSSIDFSEVLLLGDEKNVVIGTPFVKGAVVRGTILDQMKGEKIRVAKFKAKSRYHRTKGFRASLTKIKITEIKEGKN